MLGHPSHFPTDFTRRILWPRAQTSSDILSDPKINSSGMSRSHMEIEQLSREVAVEGVGRCTLSAAIDCDKRGRYNHASPWLLKDIRMEMGAKKRQRP